MHFIFRMLVARYGMDVAKKMYQKYKDERRRRDNAEAMRYQRGMTSHWIDDDE